MVILNLEWDSFGNNYVKKSFIKLGHKVIDFDFPRKTEDTRRSEELSSKIACAIIENGVDIVFSLNYFPVAAVAAYACKIKYVSWTYDSPYIQLYSKTVDLPTNLAFVFDSSEYLRLVKLGVKTVHFLPMAADVEYYDSIEVSDQEHKLYDADVAMIGSMYTESRHNFMRHLEKLDEYTKNYLQGLMESQSKVYGAGILEKGLTDEIIKRIQSVCPIEALGDGYETASWVFANYFLARHLTGIERKRMLEKLSERYAVTLYTPEKTDGLNVKNCGQVEYYKDSPKAIKCAKINLNISLRSIVNGIPLRAMDIMGCGGFLLSNYQADFDEFFVAGEDYVYFENEDDLSDKVGYYLANEEERVRIAKNGHAKMAALHTYDKRIEQMFSMI